MQQFWFRGRTFIHNILIGLGLVLLIGFYQSVSAKSASLMIVYPPNNHQTTAAKIFFIGSAPPSGQVLLNNQPIERSKQGYFAPSFPLQVGENNFTIQYQNQTINRKIIRRDTNAIIPQELGFAENSLSPYVNRTRLVGEWICFSAIATPSAQVSVQLGDKILPLLPQSQQAKLPSNAAVLTNLNQADARDKTGYYRGCQQFKQVANLGKPIFKAELNNRLITQQGQGEINIISDQNLPVIEIIVPEGVARTGPGSDYSRLTPLPQGTKARITGKEGDWLRLDYGGWILERETRLIANEVLDNANIRGVSSRTINQATEIIFPLSYPVPIAVGQEDDKFILTLYNTVAQTDTIFLVDNPLVRRLDWRQINPTTIEYTFHLNQKQQWGYTLRYQGTNLILTLAHPPQKSSNLQGKVILLDPGHGGKETGAVGPTGYTEKEINLVMSKLIKQELEKLGATVYLTRETDIDLSLPARVEMINKLQPTIALSVHYNALPDDGDAINTKGIGIFWYHPQAHNLSVFLQDYLTKNLNRPSYGVFWNNLALTRPYSRPSLLLELGFMSNPQEFEWITDTKAQKQLAQVLATGINQWFQQSEAIVTR
jgi:N-acetylmuramoyl-L-alanine amidase